MARYSSESPLFRVPEKVLAGVMAWLRFFSWASILVTTSLMGCGSEGPEDPRVVDQALLYTPSGVLVLQRSLSEAAVQVGDGVDTAEVEGALLQSGVIKRLGTGSFHIEEGPNLDLTLDTLRDAQALSRVLPVYRSLRDGTPIIPTGVVRASLPPDMSTEDIQRWAQDMGALEARLVRVDPKLYEFSVPAGSSVTVAQRMHESGTALWANPDFLVQRQDALVPNDSFVDDEWHLDRIQAFAAWEHQWGVPQVGIAVLDTGTDVDHPDLAGVIADSFDALGQQPDADPDNESPHGTSCGGLAAAEGDNGQGVAGACPGCSLLPVRLSSEANPFAPISVYSDAFYWAADQGARVISNSWGFSPGDQIGFDLDQAIAYAALESNDGAGALVLFAAGNEDREFGPSELAGRDDVLAVAATDSQDERFSYSNFGPLVAIGAPAGAVTTDLLGAPGYANGDYTGNFGGTSAATPVLAGVAGLLFSIDPDMRREHAQTLLLASAARVGQTPFSSGRNDAVGYGVVRADDAIEMLLNGIGRSCADDQECGPGGTCFAAEGEGASSCVMNCGGRVSRGLGLRGQRTLLGPLCG